VIWEKEWTGSMSAFLPSLTSPSFSGVLPRPGYQSQVREYTWNGGDVAHVAPHVALRRATGSRYCRYNRYSSSIQAHRKPHRYNRYSSNIQAHHMVQVPCGHTDQVRFLVTSRTLLTARHSSRRHTAARGTSSSRETAAPDSL
jgi:hypothetical protein